MMRCGQVRALGTYIDFANILTLALAGRPTIRIPLSPLFTACGPDFPAVDGLCPNPEESQEETGMKTIPIFIP